MAVLRMLCVVCCLVSVHGVSAAVLDTTQVYDIPEVDVVENYSHNEVRATAPLQIISRKNIEALHVLQISDAVKHLSGVTVKDYGGIGGLKTVSVRSLGAAHTAVSIDGITISDVQSGQVDIGRFSLENVDMLALSNGQSDQIFQPARQFASAAVLNIRTKAPVFSTSWWQGDVSLKGGSFGMVNPAANFAFCLHPQVSLTASAEWLGANGQYPYPLNYGTAGVDSTSTEVRQNTDVQNLRAEVSLYSTFAESSKLHFKTYYYQSERGLPGATIFYNTLNFSSQRTWDRTFFTQLNYQTDLGQNVQFQTNAKYHRGYMLYLDPTALNLAGKEEYEYSQQEYYLSASALYRAFSCLSFSLSTDGIVNTLDAAQGNIASPMRYSWLTALAAKYVHPQVQATASVLATVVSDKVTSGNVGNNHRRFSPYVGVSTTPFDEVDLRFRAFYKHIFRLPTFNDLYYGAVGNADLLPETTQQFNIGATYMTRWGDAVPQFSLTLDAYHNDVKNKIVAYPTKNIFMWTMLNYGKVAINGLDFTGDVLLSPTDKLNIMLGATYTYMCALNVTDNTLRDYGHQIPYTPRISGSGRAALETPWCKLSYTMLWSGHRYCASQNYAENRVEGYVDHSIALGHDFKIRKQTLSARIECLNIMNENYAEVRSFPMPGRSWRARVKCEL